MKNNLDTENGVQVYDIEFIVDTTEYTYEINATTGEILQKELDSTLD